MLNTIESIDPDETKLYEVKRSAFGLVVVYIMVLFGFLAAVALILLLAPVMLTNYSSSQLHTGVAVAVLLVGLVAWLALALFTYIYNQSKLIITDENLTQIIQKGLFNRQVSELSMADVEDVTADQNGLLPSLFGYGILRVETAGAAETFEFIYCPQPNFYGKVVLDAREQYLHNKRHPSQDDD